MVFIILDYYLFVFMLGLIEKFSVFIVIFNFGMNKEVSILVDLVK